MAQGHGALTANYIARMMKRRLRNASLPLSLSPYWFRVAVITDLLTQGVEIDAMLVKWQFLLVLLVRWESVFRR